MGLKCKKINRLCHDRKTVSQPSPFLHKGWSNVARKGISLCNEIISLLSTHRGHHPRHMTPHEEGVNTSTGPKTEPCGTP